jgi:thiol-disulfide isomerase/thioredoxin
VLLAAAGLSAAGHQRGDPTSEHARLDFVLKNASGVDVSLASFKGRPLVINVWATYCVPCKAEMPVLNALAEEYRARHLAVIGISYDDTLPAIAKFAKATPMHYPLLVGLGHDDLMEAYDAEGVLPTTWIIRADGTVVAKHMGAETREWFEAQVRATF